MKKFFSIILGLVLAVGLMTGCGGGSAAPAATTAAPGGAPAETAAPSAEGKTYKIAGDIVGQGVAALDDLVNEMQYVSEQIGVDFTIYNDNFTADTQTSNVQTIAASGFDGLMLFGAHSELYPVISDICKQGKLPFVFFDQIPTQEEQFEALNQNEYYAGCVGVNNYKLGVNMAKAMLEDGITKALVNGGRLGDVVQDARVNGFTDTFTEGGGEVLGTARCSNPSEATTKQDDLLVAYPDAEATYCLSGDYSVGALAALDNYPGREMSIYSSDVTLESIAFIKDGVIALGDGGGKIATILGETLIYNFVDGNPIVDENGNPARFNTVEAIPITAENADEYADLFLKGHPMAADKLAELIGPEATYEKYQDFIANLSLEAMK